MASRAGRRRLPGVGGDEKRSAPPLLGSGDVDYESALTAYRELIGRAGKAPTVHGSRLTRPLESQSHNSTVRPPSQNETEIFSLPASD